MSRTKKQWPQLAILILMSATILIGCQESLEKRAAREAIEFTQKSCPTPERDNTITDSMSFDIATHTFSHYYTLTGLVDDSTRLNGREEEMHQILVNAVRNNMSIKRYKDAGYTFRYVYHSQRDKDLVLFETIVKPEEYQ